MRNFYIHKMRKKVYNIIVVCLICFLGLSIPKAESSIDEQRLSIGSHQSKASHERCNFSGRLFFISKKPASSINTKEDNMKTRSHYPVLSDSRAQLNFRKQTHIQVSKS